MAGMHALHKILANCVRPRRSSVILRLLTRQGHLVEEEGVTYLADAHGIIDPENVLAPLQASGVVGSTAATHSAVAV